MKINALIFILLTIMMMSCNNKPKNIDEEATKEFQYFVEKFADVKIMRYQVPGF